MKYMILVTPWTTYVKKKEFFISQGGNSDNWGKDWKEVEAESIEEARKKK